MSGPVSIGIIGCGSVGQHAYLPLVASLRARGAVSRVVCSDIDPQRRAQVEGSVNVDGFSTDPREIIEDPDIDIVAVLTSMQSHAELTIAALAAGKNVLVEKPMATTMQDAQRVKEAAIHAPGSLVCAPHVLLSADFQEMHRRISQGQIGRPLLARSRYGWDGPDWSEWFYQSGGGPLFDLGVYNVTTLTGLLGPVRDVSCMAALTRPERVVAGKPMSVETDDTFQITLRHDNGVLSTVTTAFGMQKYRGPAVEVYGLDGTVQMLGDDWAPEGLELWRNEVATWQLIDGRSRYWPWTDGLSHLVECVREGTTPYTTVDHAYHVLEIMLAAMRSAETGAVQQVDSTFTPPAPRVGAHRDDLHRVHDRVHEDASR